MKIYRRESYLARLRPFYDDDIIKVITGIRRCGKSCLMQSVRDELLERGVAGKDIIYLDLDKHGNRGIKTPDQLEAAIEACIQDDGFKYLFIDEVQNVKDYEEVVNGFNTEGGFSVFITDSNSYLLSGELATKLTGRYIEFEVFTLDFAEFLGMKAFLGKDIRETRVEFEEFLQYGGFPRSLYYDDPEAKASYIEDVVRQVVKKDIKSRNKIRNMSTFEKMMSYLFNNYGATTNLTNIADYFHNVEKVAVRRETLARYIQMLEDAKVLYKCERFDMKSHQSLRGDEKYYLADLGIYFARNTDARISWGPALENVLYSYLRARGYRMSVGRIGKLECDFVCRKHNDYAYVQVAMTIADRKTEDREYRPFEHARDSYPCYLFTLDPLLQRRNGVMHLNLADFMAANQQLLQR